MQKSEWLIVFFLFSVVYSFSSFLSVDANHLSGRATSDNQTNETHLECVNSACVAIVGNGTDLCAVDADCTNTTNLTSVRSTRKTVNITHLACVNDACIAVNGTGTNLCTSDTDCFNQTNVTTHRACVNQACVILQTPGIDQCQLDTDCLNQTNLTGSPEPPPLPLAPPQPVEEKPKTLMGYILRWFGF